MAKGSGKAERLHEHAPVALGELIHAQVRVAIETAVHDERRGYRNGVKTRTLTGPTGPMAYAAFERTWGKRCAGVVTSLREGGDELRRRVKTQGSRPSEDAAVVLLFSLVVNGQIKLRRIDGWRKITAVLSQHTAVAA